MTYTLTFVVDILVDEALDGRHDGLSSVAVGQRNAVTHEADVSEQPLLGPGYLT